MINEFAENYTNASPLYKTMYLIAGGSFFVAAMFILGIMVVKPTPLTPEQYAQAEERAALVKEVCGRGSWCKSYSVEQLRITLRDREKAQQDRDKFFQREWARQNAEDYKVRGEINRLEAAQTLAKIAGARAASRITGDALPPSIDNDARDAARKIQENQ